MSWFKERFKAAGHGIEKGIDSATYNLFGKGIITGREKDNKGVYIGYSSNNGVSITTGDTAEAIMQGKLNQRIPDGNRQIYDDDFQAAMTQTPTYTTQTPTYTTPIGNMPKAYQGNTAKTATSIKQGGMTKDELIDFNNRHPNETANRG